MDADALSLTDLRCEAYLVWDAVSTPECIDDARAVIRPEMFSDTHLRSAFYGLADRWDSGHPVDAASLLSVADSSAMRALTAYPGTGGGPVSTANHAGTLRRLWVARRVRAFGDRLLRMSAEPSLLLEGALSEARAFADSLDSCLGAASEVTVAEAADELAEGLRTTRETLAAGKPVYVPTGFAFLDDRFLGGLKGGNLVVVAARPGIGKTAVILAMMMRQAALGVPVKVWSLEMGCVELAERVMYSLGGLRPGEKLTGRVDWDGAWAGARRRLDGLGLYIEDGAHGLDEICADITVSRQCGRCGVAYIDYLQLVTTPEGRGADSEERRIAGMTRRLKLLARSLDIPVVVCSQLNRDNVRDGREPSLHDLRGSGSIEQDADRVVFLSPKTGADGSRLIKMTVGKNREGGHAGDSALYRPNETYSDFDEVDEAATRQVARDAPPTLFPVSGDGEETRHPDPYFDL